MWVSKVIVILVVLQLLISEDVFSQNNSLTSAVSIPHSDVSILIEREVITFHHLTKKPLWNTPDRNRTTVFDTAHGMCTTDNDCVPWMKCYDGICKCSQNKSDFFDGKLKCEERTGALSVLDCYCMTYDNETGQIEVGACVENCMNVGKSLHDHIYHFELPPDHESIISLGNKVCGSFNREGRLCGKCQSHFRPQAYSFNMTCVSCPEGNINLWKYFVVALAPLTCFYFFVLFFKVNTITSHLHGFVLFAQTIALPEFARIIILTLKVKQNFDFPIKLMGSLYGLWSLEFFRLFTEMGTCLDMSPLSVIALDYTIAAYPFILTVLSYILIELHDRNCKILVIIWNPFRSIFILFRRQWDIRTSVIDAYATFYLLSSFKILCITYDILIPTYLYTVGEETTKLVVYYDASIDFFGREHLPYAIPAILIVFFFVVLPILLLLVYPCQCFQNFMNYCHIRSHIIHTFMDAFQGCYKDGTEPGTRDCRWFPGFDLSSRVLLFCVFSFTLGSMYFPLATIVLLSIVILVSYVQPHRASVAHYNKIMLTFYCLLALFYNSLNASDIASMKAKYFTKGCYLFSLWVGFTPLIYMSCISIRWMFSRRRYGRTFVNRVIAWRRGYDLLEDSPSD